MKAIAKRLPWSNNSIIETIAATFVFLFLYTAFSKLNEQVTFVAVLEKSPLLGPIKHLVAWAIPIVEIVLSILLIIPKTRRAGLVGSVALMSSFTLYLIYMVIFTPTLPCSCGGVIKDMTWTQHIFFNLFFTALGAVGLRLYTCNQNNNVSSPPINKLPLANTNS